MITARERATYEEMWTAGVGYDVHSPGLAYLPIFLQNAGVMRPRTVLDAGCGSGAMAVALAADGFDVTMCDLTSSGLLPAAEDLPFFEASLWRPLPEQAGALRPRYVSAWDYVVCCDVLEHVPPQFTMLTIRNLIESARQGVFLSVCLQPDHMGVWAGKALHQTVQPFVWWRDSLREVATVVDARDLISDAVFYLKP